MSTGENTRKAKWWTSKQWTNIAGLYCEVWENGLRDGSKPCSWSVTDGIVKVGTGRATTLGGARAAVRRFIETLAPSKGAA